MASAEARHLFGTFFKFVLSLVATVFAYIVGLGFSIYFGQENPVSRLAQFFLALIMSYFAFSLFWGRFRKAFRSPRLKLISFYLMIGGFAPFELVIPSPFSSLPALVVMLVPVLWRRLPGRMAWVIPAFRFELRWIVFVRVWYRVFERGATPPKVDYVSAFGFGLSDEGALRMASRKGRKLLRAGRVPFPAHENEVVSDSRLNSELVAQDIECMMCLAFARHRYLGILTEANLKDYEGYFDVFAMPKGSGFEVTVLGSGPTSFSNTRLFLLKETWEFVEWNHWEDRGVRKLRPLRSRFGAPEKTTEP
jgi:hypothetical protein